MLLDWLWVLLLLLGLAMTLGGLAYQRKCDPEDRRGPPEGLTGCFVMVLGVLVIVISFFAIIWRILR